MSDLRLTFSDVYTQVSSFIGWTAPGTAPTGTNLSNAKNVVHRGYRRFLRPVNIRTGKRHIWSFLEQWEVLNTESGKWLYTLPKDFHTLRCPFKHEVDSGYPSMKSTSFNSLLQKRAGQESTSFPHFYAIRAQKYSEEIGTIYEVGFFETPNANYRLNYSYLIRPQKLDSATDVFVGGDLASEVILEHCLAIAEQEYDDTLGIHTQMAQELTQQLILNDESTIPNSVGPNIDTSVKTVSFERPLPLTETDNIY